MQTKEHWEKVYSTNAATQVSWFQEHAAMSLQLITRQNVPLSAAIIDVGGGASTLVDDLLDAGVEFIAPGSRGGEACPVEELLQHVGVGRFPLDARGVGFKVSVQAASVLHREAGLFAAAFREGRAVGADARAIHLGDDTGG